MLKLKLTPTVPSAGGVAWRAAARAEAAPSGFQRGCARADGARAEIRDLAEALRRDALLWVEGVVSEHSKRLQLWADGLQDSPLSPLSPPSAAIAADAGGGRDGADAATKGASAAPPEAEPERSPETRARGFGDAREGAAPGGAAGAPGLEARSRPAFLPPGSVPARAAELRETVAGEGCWEAPPAPEARESSKEESVSCVSTEEHVHSTPKSQVCNSEPRPSIHSFGRSSKRTETQRSRASLRDRPILTTAKTSDVLEWVHEQQEQNGEKVTEEDGCVKKAVRSSAFDKVMGFVLILNALSIGVKVDWMARSKATSVPIFFICADWFFVTAFVVELIMRVTAGPRDFFRGKEWKWNWFDVFVVAMQIGDEITQLIGDSAHEAMDSVSFVRIFRLARLMRFVRMVRLLSGLKSVVYLLMASMSSFLWAALMLWFLTFCCAVYFTEMSTTSIQGTSPQASAIISRYWGSLPRSMLTLFKALFGGFDWEGGLDAFEEADTDNILNTVVMISYISFTTLVMLNLVTGVFVEGAQRIVKEDRDKELLALAAFIFEFGDENGDQDLDQDEFMQIVNSEPMKNFCESNKIEVDEVQCLFQLLKEPDSDSVPIGHFVHACELLQGDARSADLQAMKLMCKTFFEESDDRMARIEAIVSGGMQGGGGGAGAAVRGTRSIRTSPSGESSSEMSRMVAARGLARRRSLSSRSPANNKSPRNPRASPDGFAMASVRTGAHAVTLS